MMKYSKIRNTYLFIFCIIAILSISCSSINKYYNREYNVESKILNEYLYSFIEKTEPYHQGSKIYLHDELYVPKESYCCENLENYPDSLFLEAHLNLKSLKNSSIPINFSQLTRLTEYRIYPDNRDKYDYNNWEYEISRPGFSKDSTHIVFISSYYCGSLCASIDLNFMKITNGKWILVRSINIMMS